MTNEEQVLLMLQGVHSQMEPADKAKVTEAQEAIQAIIDNHGEHGQFALSMVGAGLAAEDAKKTKALDTLRRFTNGG